MAIEDRERAPYFAHPENEIGELASEMVRSAVVKAAQLRCEKLSSFDRVGVH